MRVVCTCGRVFNVDDDVNIVPDHGFQDDGIEGPVHCLCDGALNPGLVLEQPAFVLLNGQPESVHA